MPDPNSADELRAELDRLRTDPAAWTAPPGRPLLDQDTAARMLRERDAAIQTQAVQLQRMRLALTRAAEAIPELLRLSDGGPGGLLALAAACRNVARGEAAFTADLPADPAQVLDRLRAVDGTTADCAVVNWEHCQALVREFDRLRTVEVLHRTLKGVDLPAAARLQLVEIAYRVGELTIGRAAELLGECLEDVRERGWTQGPGLETCLATGETVEEIRRLCGEVLVALLNHLPNAGDVAPEEYPPGGLLERLRRAAEGSRS